MVDPTVLLGLALLAGGLASVCPVPVALGFVVTFVFSRSTVRAEEAGPVPAPATV